MSIYQDSVTLTKDNTTGWTDRVLLPRLGIEGELLLVQVREDASANDATAADIYILTADTAAPTDAQVVYKASAVALSGSATASSLNDAVGDDTPAAYVLSGLTDRLYAAANITATTGGGGATTSLYLKVQARGC